VGELSWDATAIETREKPPKNEPVQKVAANRGRLKLGKERIKSVNRIEKQAEGMSLTDMLDDLPKACDVGAKKNTKGNKISLTDYKLHFDVADGGIPISPLLTSASTHDSQARFLQPK
jgi:hypothetical protein